MLGKNRKTWIKICGITSIDDALAAAELGVDSLGFVFADSKRRISPEKAGEIIRQLPPSVITVGVFMDQPVETVRRIVEETMIDMVQLHGSEKPEYCRQINKRVIKRIAVQNTDTKESLSFDMKRYNAFVFLLDPGRGDGHRFDWTKAVGIGLPLIIAGGLTPGNVREAIQTLRPFGVDVSSGVEKSPGRKDIVKIRQFIEEVE